ncbi:MAG: chromosomal replication initiator protein DnaA [Planctomycetes bacterium]|nr:chromosomal replication initiator protein DnaA [Planctomycetota bacterium]
MIISTEGQRADTDVKGAILTMLQDKIGPQKFNAWFKHGTVLNLEDGLVRISVPNPFVANWIETHYQGDISDAANTATGTPHSVVVAIDPSLCDRLHKRQLDIQADMVAKATQGRSRQYQPARNNVLRHRLEDFVMGQSNKMAYSAALALAGGKANFNPLFVYGPCGVGKTHLLQGICNSLSRMSRDGRPLTWRYVTGEQFTNEFIASIRQKRASEFRPRYRGLDLLAIDDVHFLAAKRATQDEFLHTFNAIQSAGNQIVMASDAHPRLVGDLNEQLVSRFVAGMVVKIDQPDQATRMEILRRFARRMNMQVGDDVLEYVALHIRASVRDLEGAMIKLSALAAVSGGTVTLEITREALAEYLSRADSAITLGDIEAVTSVYFGITPADMHSSRRTRTVSVARMVAMYLARRHTRMSFPEIGKSMGKNHSSVVLAVQKLQEIINGGGELDWMSPAGLKAMPAAKVVELLNEQIA